MFRFFSKKWSQNKDCEQNTIPLKVKATNESNATTTELMDMNVDCLEHIFSYLSLEDLLNIVHTNRQLKPAAELAFARNFGRGKLVFLEKNSNRAHVKINGSKKVGSPNPYRLLREFGHLIFKQKIGFGFKHILKYVNQYCCESTTEITISWCTLAGNNRMDKPFRNAETVCFDKCRFRAKFNRLNKLFPSVRNLSFENCNLDCDPVVVLLRLMGIKLIEAYFPYLNQLKIDGSSYAFRVNAYVNMLRLNPQLRYLILKTPKDKTLLRVANLQFLEYLHIMRLDDHFGTEVFNFACLKELKISTYLEPTKIPISSSCLKEFSFACGKLRENYDILFDFLKKHPSITKLTLTSSIYVNLNKETLIKIIEEMPSMEEIYISMLKISVNDAIQLVNNCKSLKKLCFKANDNADIDRVKARLGVKWQATSKKFKKKKRYDITIVKRDI